MAQREKAKHLQKMLQNSMRQGSNFSVQNLAKNALTQITNCTSLLYESIIVIFPQKLNIYTILRLSVLFASHFIV